MTDKSFEEIFKIANLINNLHEEAYRKYLGPVNMLCNNLNASENEVDMMLDYLFDFCGNEKVLGLYKKVCRTFYKEYPECIANHIMWYREQYDSEPLKN